MVNPQIITYSSDIIASIKVNYLVLSFPQSYECITHRMQHNGLSFDSTFIACRQRFRQMDFSRLPFLFISAILFSFPTDHITLSLVPSFYVRDVFLDRHLPRMDDAFILCSRFSLALHVQYVRIRSFLTTNLLPFFPQVLLFLVIIIERASSALSIIVSTPSRSVSRILVITGDLLNAL